MEAICTAIGAIVILIGTLTLTFVVGLMLYCGIAELIDNIRYKRRARL